MIAPTEETVSKTPMNSILTERQKARLYVALYEATFRLSEAKRLMGLCGRHVRGFAGRKCVNRVSRLNLSSDVPFLEYAISELDLLGLETVDIRDSVF